MWLPPVLPLAARLARLCEFTPDIARDIGLGTGILHKEFFIQFQHGSLLRRRPSLSGTEAHQLWRCSRKGGAFIGLVEKREEEWGARHGGLRRSCSNESIDLARI